MYTVSEAYKSAVKANYRTCYIQGIIQTVTGSKIEFEDRDISEGSLYITNQCVSNNDFEYGAVFAAELGMSLKTDADRYTFYDATVTLSYFLLVGSEVYEEIPLGIFHVEDAEREGSCINITAYDNMILLDEAVAAKQAGTAYQMLQTVVEKCGITLAQDETYINSLPNGTRTLTIDPQDLETYRDAVSQLAAVLTCFATINRAGQLELRRYGQDTVEVERNQRFSTKISDFYTFYDSITANCINGEEYKSYSTSKEELQGGLAFDMGDMPVICGKDSANTYIVKKIFEELVNVSYTPFEISYNGNPAIDLGDKIVIKNIDGKEENLESVVMLYDWHYRRNSDLKAMGGNPRIQKRNSESSTTGRSSGETAGNDTVVYGYTNNAAINLSGTEKTVVSITFATVSEATPVAIVTIPFSLDIDGNVTFYQYLDGVLMNGQVMTEYCDKGKHIVAISNNFVTNEGSVKKYEVKMKTAYVESDTRVQKAKIESILGYINTGTYTEKSIDTTVPEGFIQRGAINAVIFGQGLASEAPWDGMITVGDVVSVSECAESYDALGIMETLTVKDKITTPAEFAETIDVSVMMAEYGVVGYSDSVTTATAENTEE